MCESGGYSVTVTVPVYNSSEFIDDCLDNLSKQNYDISEIIFVVDERTTDDSEEKLRKRAEQSANVKVVIQTDGKGLAGARNIGIKEAKSEVIWFLDVDDIPHPDFLKDLIDIMSKTDADTVVCNHIQSFERGDLKIPDKEYTYKVYEGKYAASHYTDFPIYSWSRIQKTSVFNEDSMFRDRPAAEDIEQTIRQYAVSRSVCYYDKPLYKYVKRKASATKNNRNKEIQSLEDTAKSLLPFIKEKIPEDYDELERRILLNLMRQSTFSDYHFYSESYKGSITHDLLRGIEDKSAEMKIYSFSKTLYYLVLYPFSHFLWDRKNGQWKSS